jgi:hypothetical protein
MPLAARRGDQRGIALSSPLALVSAAAVVLAGAAFVVTDGPRPDAPREVAAPVTSSPSPTRTAPTPVVRKKRPAHKRRVVRRGDTYVEVFNNSGISGLAASTAARASGAGWQVVGSDNWYGTIPATTVYYPARLHPQARMLARDLGIHRLRLAIAPMRGDRLTVILTSDFS